MNQRLLVGIVFLAACNDSRGTVKKPADFDATIARAGGDLPLLAADGPGVVAHRDDRTGLATFVWGDALDAATKEKRRTQAVEVAAQAYVADYGPRFGLTRAQAKQLELGQTHDLGTGAIIVGFKQRAFGYDVFRGELKVAMTRERALVAMSGNPSPHLAPGSTAKRLTFVVSPESALAFAYTDVTGEPIDENEFHSTGEPQGPYERYLADAAARLIVPARVKRVLFPLPDRVEPAYYLELSTSSDHDDHFAYVLSAKDGAVLFRKNLTAAAFTYRVWAQPDGFPLDGPQGDHTPHPTGQPDGFEPPFEAPTLITLDHGPISTNDPWLPPNSVSLIGNNVFAYGDAQKPDGFSPGDFLPFVTSDNTFDRTYDPTKPPGADTNQVLAAATQLFYVNNFLHDWFYDAGFKEVDGNAQTSNYERGGLENDAIKAEANDFSGIDNANMSTPADGEPPRMQMYAFKGIVKLVADVTAPAGMKIEKIGTGDFGLDAFDFNGDLALAEDDADPKGDVCTPIVNTAAVAGKIAVIDRGSCPYVEKVQRAQDAGAVAVLIVNNTAGGGGMSGQSTTLKIGSFLIDQASGNALKAKLAAGETVSVHMVRPKQLDRAGTLDNMIVAHEWGHYISNRLVGNASGLSATISHGLGEGWGDFTSMLLTVRESDALLAANPNYSGAYAMAQYTMTGGGNQGYYHGIRRAPYSTNLEINPLTYRHIANGEALPTARFWEYGQDGKNNAEVHATGEVWAQMLWECYAALLNETTRGLAFDEKRDRMKRYVVAAYKMTPMAPTLLEAKDALLAVALAADRADFELFTNAFAKRGAGLRAVAPPKNAEDNVGARESFLTGPDLMVTSVSVAETTPRCTPDNVLSDGEVGTVTLVVKNVGNAPLTGATAIVTSPTPGVTFQGGGLVTLPPMDLLQSATVTTPVTLSVLGGIARIDLEVVVTNPSLVLPAVTAKHAVLGNYAVQRGALASDDVESPDTAWKLAHDPTLSKTAWTRDADDVEHHFWRGASQSEPADLYLISPILNVASTGDFSFTFKHRYRFEWQDKKPPRTPEAKYFDGGVIEISNDGITWTDIGDKASPTYNAKIVDKETKSPLIGRAAYSGDSAGYPAWETVTVSLGNAYAGQNVLVRFRSASDDASVAVGWDIDDLAFTNVTNTPFTKLVPAACP